MRWTNVPPDEDGWYWAQRNRNEAPEIVEVELQVKTRDGLFIPTSCPVSRMGNDNAYMLEEFEFWSETRIPEPTWGPGAEEGG